MDSSKFHQLIEQRRKDLLLSISRTTDETAPVELDQTKVGRLSRMDALQTQQINLAAERRKNIELVALDAAQKRLDNGEFGYCVDCGEEINPKRLEIDLTNTLCITCANKLEVNKL